MNKDLDENALAHTIRQAGGNDRPLPEHRDRLREQALKAFDQAVASVQPALLPDRKRRIWRWIMNRPVSRYVATAAGAALVLLVLWAAFGTRQEIAFADLIQPILEAKTATFKVTVRPQGQQPVTSDVSVSGLRLRSELPGGMVQITDFSRGRQILLHPAGKMATVVEMKNLPKEGMPANYLDQFRNMLRQAESDPEMKREELGEKQIDGQRSVGYRITRGSEEWILWFNPDLRMPVRVETSSSFIPDTEMTMSDFRCDVALDESIFSLTPPEGYKVRKIEQNMARRTEKDFIASLRWASDALDGRFPDALTFKEFANIVEAAARKRESGEKETQAERESKRGFTFPYSLPPSADPHYAGRGVRRGEKDRPIFWYRPADSDKYRVIYADLTVRETAEAPDLPDAERIGVENGRRDGGQP